MGRLKEWICDEFFDWLLDKLFVVGALVLCVVLLMIPTFFPYLDRWIAGGMPRPERPPVLLSSGSVTNAIGNAVKGTAVEVRVADAFVCKSYSYVPTSLLSAGRTVSAKEDYEFWFAGVIARQLGVSTVKLPKIEDMILECEGNRIPAALPTSGEPFRVIELRDRSRLFFFSFADDPYGFSAGGLQTQSQELSGYVVFAKPKSARLSDCHISIKIQPEDTEATWILSQ